MKEINKTYKEIKDSLLLSTNHGTSLVVKFCVIGLILFGASLTSPHFAHVIYDVNKVKHSEVNNQHSIENELQRECFILLVSLVISQFPGC